MNEFGQINVDQQLISQQQGYAVKELLGGCLCCSSQLPMQIGLARLLSEKQTRPTIYRTHRFRASCKLLEQLTEPHWQKQSGDAGLWWLWMAASLHDQDWVAETLYTDQLKAAQIVVISH